ncbi:hypothetical protein [Enterococcus gallinarum]
MDLIHQWLSFRYKPKQLTVLDSKGWVLNRSCRQVNEFFLIVVSRNSIRL